MSRREFGLLFPTQSNLTSVKFAPSLPIVAAGSWDESVRIYSGKLDSETQPNVVTFDSGVVDLCWESNSIIYVGCANGDVIGYDIKVGVKQTLGSHQALLKHVRYNPAHVSIFSGGLDRVVMQFDPRAGASLLNSLSLPGKVFAMDTTDNLLALGLSEQLMMMYDIRKLKRPLRCVDGPFEHSVRCIRCLSDGTRFAASSMDGRIAIVSTQQSTHPAIPAWKVTHNAPTFPPIHALDLCPGFIAFCHSCHYLSSANFTNINYTLFVALTFWQAVLAMATWISGHWIALLTRRRRKKPRGAIPAASLACPLTRRVNFLPLHRLLIQEWRIRLL